MKKHLKIVLKNWKGVFKMGKPVITYEQADKISEWEYHTGHPGRLLKLHVKNKLSKHSNCLKIMSLDQLARAIYVGYEVEVEVEVGDWLVNNRNGLMFQIEDRQEDKDIARMNHIRHATESEIAEEEKSRMDKKINEIWIGLSDYERNGFYRKLECGDY